MWRAWEWEKRGNGAKGRSNEIPAALTVSGDFIVDAEVRLLCSGSSAFLSPSSGHGSTMVSVSVATAAFDGNAPKGTRFCQVLGTLQAYCMKDINL